MRQEYKSKGLVFDISIENIPRVWSEPKFLIGHNILDPKLIFISSFKMKLYEINTPLNGQKNYAISGFTINGCKKFSQPRLILEMEDQQQIKIPKVRQEPQQTFTYCNMMKSYANVLKGKTQVNKNITEEN